jgi:uncharacterized delta-60 repeat protein
MDSTDSLIRKNRAIGIISLMVLFLLLNSCKKPYLIGDPANINMADNGTITFDTVSVGSLSTREVILRNLGQTKAKITSTSGLGSTFSYVGGIFPGVGGTCSDILGDSGESCSLQLSFSPPSGGGYSGTLILNYESGEGQSTLSLGLQGSAVPQGAIDTTFGVNGYSIHDFDGDTDAEKIKDILVQQDNKVLLIGQTDGGAGGDDNILLSRVNEDGGLDRNFGNGGSVSTDTGANANDIVETAILTDDGSIIVAGGAGSNAFISQYLPTGVLDTLFGPLASGINKLSSLVVGSTDRIYDSLTTDDGRIIIIGETITLVPTISQMFAVRLTALGIIDVSVPIFGSLGVSLFNFGTTQNNRALTVALQADEKILVGGYVDQALERNSVIARLLPTGILDATFGTAGKVTLSVCSGVQDDEVRDSVVDTDNTKILITGKCNNGGNEDIYIARLSEDGSLDTSFNSGGATPGVLSIDISGTNDEPAKIHLSENNKIIVSGYTVTATAGDEPFMIRVNSNGSMDTNFGVNGVNVLGIGLGQDRAEAFAMQGDKILMGGHSTQNSMDLLITRHFQ